VNREQFEHLIRAAGSLVGDDELLVIGSQAILGSFSQDELPAVATLSNEVDIAFFDDPLGRKADMVEGTIGERSPFEELHKVYAQGVSVTTAVLPSGWRKRLVPVLNPNTRGVTALCLEVHDLWVSKLAAGRSNDIAYCEALIRDGLVDISVLLDRLGSTDLPTLSRELAEGVIRRTELWGDESPEALSRADAAGTTGDASDGRTWVPGYMKVDGTCVKGHWRR